MHKIQVNLIGACTDNQTNSVQCVLDAQRKSRHFTVALATLYVSGVRLHNGAHSNALHI